MRRPSDHRPILLPWWVGQLSVAAFGSASLEDANELWAWTAGERWLVNGAIRYAADHQVGIGAAINTVNEQNAAIYETRWDWLTEPVREFVTNEGAPWGVWFQSRKSRLTAELPYTLLREAELSEIVDTTGRMVVPPRFADWLDQKTDRPILVPRRWMTL